MPDPKRKALHVPCPHCGQPAGQRCIKGPKRHRLVPPDYYGPYRFHAARRLAADSQDAALAAALDQAEAEGVRDA